MRQLLKTQLSEVVLGSTLKSASANPILIFMGPVLNRSQDSAVGTGCTAEKSEFESR
jgi:hypothetical protein